MFTTPAYKAMRDKCISQDLSWAKPAKKWEAILIGERAGGRQGPPAGSQLVPAAAT